MTFHETKISGQRFDLGKMVITRGALSYCEDHDIDYLELVMRHASGDFGSIGKLNVVELTPEERELGALVTDDGLKLNAIAIESKQGMIMSVYPPPVNQKSKVWIQTLLAQESTYTTVLLPSEY